MVLVLVGLDDVTKERVSEGVSVLEETHQDSKSRDSASVPEQAADLDHSKELLEETLVEEPLEKSQDNEEYDDDFELSSRRSKRDKTDKVKLKSCFRRNILNFS